MGYFEDHEDGMGDGKTLVLFTNEFPYGYWEPYLEEELGFLGGFEQIIIVALQLRKDHMDRMRMLPDNCAVLPVPYASRFVYLLNAIPTLLDINLWRDLRSLINTGTLTANRLVDLFVWYSRAHYEARVVLRKLKGRIGRRVLFYSYRFEYQPYVALLVRKGAGVNGSVVSRAHGYDLYEDRHAHGYIPGREILLSSLDAVWPCSEHGVRYLDKTHPGHGHVLRVQYLGSRDYGWRLHSKGKVLRIVSCSNLVPLKRVEMIGKAMSIVKCRVSWTHFGDGPLMDAVRNVTMHLPDNATCDLRGQVSHDELMRIYCNEEFDLFINVSTAEGVPVSIMEAMSFGIPCIATEVGGTGELVSDGNTGTLLPMSTTAEKLAQEIEKYCLMDDEDYRLLCTKTRHRWQSKFDASRNYNAFSAMLMNMTDSKSWQEE